jgi:hypothetical protein
MPRPAPPAPTPLAQYEVEVRTGSKFGAGTEARVTCQLRGSAGRATSLLSATSLLAGRHGGSSSSMFSRGSVDCFGLSLPDCGELQALALWMDPGTGGFFSGSKSEWWPDKVVVTLPATGAVYEASFSCWLRAAGQAAAATRPLTLVKAGVAPAMAAAGAPATGAGPQPPCAAGVTAPPATDGAAASAALHAPVSPRVVDRDQFAAALRAQLDSAPPAAAAAPLPGDAFADAERLPAQLQGVEPTCEWQRYTVRLPADPRYEVTYYHNVTTGGPCTCIAHLGLEL